MFVHKVFLQFKEADLIAIIGQWKFEHLRPFYVKKMRQMSSCCYIYHVEIDQLWLGLNNMKVTFELHGIRKCSCTCPYVYLRDANQFSCNVMSSIYPCITMMWQILVCFKKDEGEWHHKKCLYKQCNDGGIKKIPLCPI